MNKIVAEVRFSGQLNILDNLSKIARCYYPSFYPHWRIDNNSTVRIYNNKIAETSTEIILYDHTRFIYSVENPPTNNYFIEKYMKYYHQFEKYIEIDDITRIGVRNITLCEQKTKDSTLDKYKKVYLDEFLKTLCDSRPVDYFNVIEFMDRRITFGPLAKDEKNQYLNEFSEKEKIPNDAFLIDIDVFSQQTKKKEVEKKLLRHNEIVKTLTTTIISQFGDKIKNEK